MSITQTAGAVAEDDNIEASRVNGTNVYNAAGESLGTVYDLVIGKRDGKVKYAVMSFDGFLGNGEEYYPLPWSQLDYDVNMGGFVVDLDKDRLWGRYGIAATTLRIGTTASTDIRSTTITPRAQCEEAPI